ncbi:MAG: hypothetical protein AAFU54_29465 [Chloroflexota bacterium]
MSEKQKNIQPSWQVRTLKVGNRIELRRRWHKRNTPGLTPIAIVWNLISAFWVFLVVPNDADVSLMTWQVLVYVTAGVVMGYYALAWRLNTTRAFVAGTRLLVINLPLPLHAFIAIDARRIIKIEVVRSLNTDRGSPPLHDVVAYTWDGEAHILFRSLDRLEDGKFLMQELEFILGLDGDGKGKRT